MAEGSRQGEPDLYAVLGGAPRSAGTASATPERPLPAVGREASDDDIKKAYRLQAQTLHPDKHSSAALREVRGAGGGAAACAAVYGAAFQAAGLTEASSHASSPGRHCPFQPSPLRLRGSQVRGGAAAPAKRPRRAACAPPPSSQ